MRQEIVIFIHPKGGGVKAERQGRLLEVGQLQSGLQRTEMILLISSWNLQWFPGRDPTVSTFVFHFSLVESIFKVFWRMESRQRGRERCAFMPVSIFQVPQDFPSPMVPYFLVRRQPVIMWPGFKSRCYIQSFFFKYHRLPVCYKRIIAEPTFLVLPWGLHWKNVNRAGDVAQWVWALSDQVWRPKIEFLAPT